MLLSRNYPAAPALAPYLRRIYVFEADLPPDHTVIDRLLAETAFIRILLKGEWLGEVAPGDWRGAGPVVLFGSNFRPFTVKVTGPFRVIGVSIHPSAWRTLFGRPASDYADSMCPLHDLWGDDADRLLHGVRDAADDTGVVAAIEAVVADRIARADHPTDPQMLRFEYIARNDSTIRVVDAAERLGLSVRQMERQCRAAFGHSPKAVLRRSRALDMAMAMRGFSRFSADELAALNYFDQSHLNREFRHFFGMTPGAFAAAPTPLFTAGLKLRAEGLY
ncbi:helix-turn-helix domain-containing protein [Sphingomonas flavalba]|uniref:helix-turn-helix domain-containing protein n=1 Tax=Sphingomonas flavalba TaxID=2559804 RepID=UPI0039E06FB2